MKRIFSIGYMLAIVAVGLVGCNNDPEEVKYYTTETSGPTPTLEGFNQLTVTVPDALALSDSDEFLFTWEADEKFSVYESDGEWVADMKINDASTAVSVFTVEGDVRFDDDTKYVAVYPARSSDQTTYEDYVTAALSMSAEQNQVDETYDHLKDESYLEVEFKGDDAIVFENQKAVTVVSFEVEDTYAPASVKLVSGDSQSYTLNFVAGSKASSKVSHIAYMMINPIEETGDEHTLSCAVLASDGKELINTEIKTTSGLSSGNLYDVDLVNGTVTEGSQGESGGGDDDDDDDDDKGEGSGSDTEDLTPDEGEWL